MNFRPLTVAVIVPTFERPDALLRCLDGLRAQTRPPDRTIVVVRDVDTSTIDVLEHDVRSLDAIELVRSSEPGQVAAIRAGLAAADTDVVALTDDDAVPRPDWLHRIEQAFLVDARVGAVGGRDHVHPAPPNGWGAAETVGVITWWGKIVGEHHRGVGPARPVQILKGANMAYRLAAVGGGAPDPDLRGGGAEPDNDMEISLAVWAAGWSVIYDPAIAVDHHVEPKESSRGSSRQPADSFDAAFNRTLALRRHLPTRRYIAVRLYSIAVGTPLAPGLLQTLRHRRRGVRLGGRHLVAAMGGARSGARHARFTPPQPIGNPPVRAGHS